MRICFLLPRLAVSRDGVFVGGSVVSALRLARTLRHTHQIDFVGGADPARVPLLHSMSTCGLRFRPIAISSCPSSLMYGLELLLKALLQFRSDYNTHGYDLVHGHSGFAVHAAHASIIRQGYGLPSVQTIYCPIANSVQWPQSVLFGPWISKLILSGVDHIIAMTNHVRQSLLCAGIEGNHVSVIPPLIDRSEFNVVASKQQARKEFGLPQEDKVVLFVGSLKPNKGFRTLLEAFAVVKSVMRNLQLVVTFEFRHAEFNREREVMLKMIEGFSLQPSITEFGIIPNMPELMVAADVLVVPFLDTFGPSDYPLVILESMALGRPVIATRVGGIPEIVAHEQTGLLVPAGDKNVLASQLLRLLEDVELYNHLKDEARQFVSDKFAVSEVVGRTEAIYRNLVERRA